MFINQTQPENEFKAKHDKEFSCSISGYARIWKELNEKVFEQVSSAISDNQN